MFRCHEMDPKKNNRATKAEFQVPRRNFKFDRKRRLVSAVVSKLPAEISGDGVEQDLNFGDK